MRDAGTLTQDHREFQVLLASGSLLNCIRTGIGPEVFAWKTADGQYSGDPLTAEQEAYYQVTLTYDALYRAGELNPPPGTRILPRQRPSVLLPQTRSSGIKLHRLANNR